MAATLGEADASFPSTAVTGLPPAPTRENPGAVYPKSDPSPAPRTSSPGKAFSEEKAEELRRIVRAQREVHKFTDERDPQSAETGGMFKD